MTGPSRGDSEETEREKGDVVCCEEISERWDFIFLFSNICFFEVLMLATMFSEKMSLPFLKR